MHVRSPLLGPSQSPSRSGEYLVLVQRSMALMANIATASCSRARRAASTARFSPGFYRALNSQTSAIDNCSSSNVTGRPKATNLILLEEVAGASDSELPPGCYLVERLIAVRKTKYVLPGAYESLFGPWNSGSQCTHDEFEFSLLDSMQQAGLRIIIIMY